MPVLSSEGSVAGWLAGWRAQGPLWSSPVPCGVEGMQPSLQSAPCRLAEHIPPAILTHISPSLSSLKISKLQCWARKWDGGKGN